MQREMQGPNESGLSARLTRSEDQVICLDSNGPYPQSPPLGNNKLPTVGSDIAVDTTEAATEQSNEGPANVSLSNAASDEEIGAFDDSHLQVDGQKKKKKRKNKKRPKSKRGLLAPTGFEEYSADAPITPAEYEEEKTLYDLDLPFTERIMTAIRRYEGRRKMTPVHRDFFYKYLAYGGIDVGPNMFQAISHRDKQTMEKDTLTDAMAQSSLSQEVHDMGKESSKWVVDFEGVMKGFLSRRVRSFYPLDTEAEVSTITNLMSNFMNYLLHHDVCPEYKASVLAARKVCTSATLELWSAHQAEKWLPGDFNIACSTLFDGVYSQRYDGETTWANFGEEFVGQTDDQARQIIKFAVALAGSDEQYQRWYDKAMANEIKVTRVRTEVFLEITQIVLPEEETREYYKQRTKDFRPVGKIYTKGWDDPAALPEDLTPEEQAQRKQLLHQDRHSTEANPQLREAGEDEYEFFVEEVILQHLSVGMKFEASVRTLNCGIHFIDEVFNIYLTYDTFLPNERMYGYKEGRFMEGVSVAPDGSMKYSAAGKDGEENGGAEDED